MIWSVVATLVCLYTVLTVLMYVFQARLIFFPDKHIVMTPQDIGMQYESVELVTEDGVTLAGWFVPAEISEGVVLFCHGNAGNISHRIETIRVFNQLGLDTFIFDYRGYGESNGVPSETGMYMDAEAAWRYLTETRQIAHADVVLFGKSLGGAVAAWLAQDKTPRSLVVESTFTSVPDAAADAYPIFPVRFLARYKFGTIEYIQNVTCPVLVIHSRDDEMIPFKLGQQLFDIAHEPKQFLELRGSHNEGFVQSSEIYKKGLAEFLVKKTDSKGA